MISIFGSIIFSKISLETLEYWGTQIESQSSTGYKNKLIGAFIGNKVLEEQDISGKEL